MSKTLRIIIIAIVILIGAVALLGTGFAFGRATWGMGGFYPGGMMGNYNQNDPDAQYGYGMMSGSGDYGMMGNQSGYSMMEPGMMGGSGYGPGGMMGGYGNSANEKPLSVEETRDAVENYLASFENEDLEIDEIMIFRNNAYAIIVEKSTGFGAFELLVDPVTEAVFPEYGPNMMWNLKYGMMSGFGGYGMMGPGMMMGGSRSGPGGMMDEFGSDNNGNTPDVSAELSVNPEEALEAAQRYLDQYSPGVEVSDEITPFYGYYTVDIERDGEIVGMLSVNGFTRQVFPHTWHGDFIEMVESDHK